ncbi:hypothetical protein ACXYFN_01480 [Mycoplasma sp. 48589B]
MITPVQYQEIQQNSEINALNLLAEEDKIEILLFIDFLSHLSLEEICINDANRETLVSQLKETVKYEKIKKSLETRRYFWSSRAIEKKDIFYLKHLPRYLRDALTRIKNGRKDMLITHNTHPGKSMIPAIFNIVMGIFSLARKSVSVFFGDIEGIISAPVTVPLSIKKIVTNSMEIDQLRKKQYDINSNDVKEAIEFIQDRVDDIEKMINKIIEKNTENDDDIDFQNEAFGLIKSWIIEFNIMVKQIVGLKFYERTLLDNYTDFLGHLINRNMIDPSRRSAWLYNPVIGDYYDPY